MPDMYAEFEAVRESAFSGTATEDGMHALLGRWRHLLGPDAFERGMAVDYAADVKRLAVWFESALEKEPALRGMEALCFTLCTRNNGIFDLRLTGSDCFIVETDSFFEDTIYSESVIPENSHSESKALGALSGILPDAASEDAAALVPYAYAVLAVSEICRGMDFAPGMDRDGIRIVIVHEYGFPLVIGNIGRHRAA